MMRTGRSAPEWKPEELRAEPAPTEHPLRSAPPPASGDLLVEACRALGRAQGIEFRVPRRTAAEGASTVSVAELCDASGVRHRKVTFEDGWWKRDNGPLLAFLRQPAGAAARPVAVVPAGRRGYLLFDPACGARQPVDGAVAERLEPGAIVFYRPLPERPLRLADLLRAGLHGCRPDLAALLAATLCSGLPALLTPIVTRRIVDSSIARSDRVEVVHMALALGVAAVAAALLELARTVTLLRLKSRTAVSLQAALWDRLLSLPAPFFRRFTIGDLTARSMGIDEIQFRLTTDITAALFAAVSALFSLAILFYYSRPLALLAAGSTVLLASLVAATAWRQLHDLRELHLLNGKLGGLAYGLLSGIAKLRVGGAERRGFAQWAGRFSEQRDRSIAVHRLSIVQVVLGSVYGPATSIAVFAMIGLSSNLQVSVGGYMAFNAAFTQFQLAALAAIGVIPTLLGFVPTYERLKPILEAVPESSGRHADPGPLRGEVELRDVCFQYEADSPVLDGVSLKAAPGEFVALVGPSGSGKSTCLRLLLGFERPASGAVLIDGHDIGALDMHLVRRQLGVVLQNGRPLVGDIFRNIVGSLPLTLEDAWGAAERVGLDEEIAAMPMGMFTFVNERGVSFSGGQRQRLLLARALVNRPRLLLLDEATSALDNRTQATVTRSLAELGVTRIVVAHRLSTVRRADRVYVLEHGRVVEEGTFAELMARGGLLARMATQQGP
jgi:NHLM bacteriocin system ABC transporter ATP-binding protein